MFDWCRDTYRASVCSRCWHYSTYDEGWIDGVGIAVDEELKEIVRTEYELRPIPDWAKEVVERGICFVPPCGHHTFPEPFLKVIDAIGREEPPGLCACCFTVRRDRKRELMDYCLCMDAWLAGAKPEPVARELNALGYRKTDWNKVCKDLWEVLGEHNEAKDLLVERKLLQQRWAIKNQIWDDDPASEFGRDSYAGDYNPDVCFARSYGNPTTTAGHFELEQSPRIKHMEARLAEICPDWEKYRDWIVLRSWGCHPKALRFLERCLWEIGRGQMSDIPSEDYNTRGVPRFLGAEDTAPAAEDVEKWWRAFLAALDGWWRGKPESGCVADRINIFLGKPTPLKEWLVRLYKHRLTIHEKDAEMRVFLVPEKRDGWGTRPVECYGRTG